MHDTDELKIDRKSILFYKLYPESDKLIKIETNLEMFLKKTCNTVDSFQTFCFSHFANTRTNAKQGFFFSK